MATDFFASLNKKTAKAANEKKVWGLPLESVVIPYLAAEIVAGNVDPADVPLDALGCPYTLLRDKETGALKFSDSGGLRTGVRKEIKAHVNGTMRENFIAHLNRRRAAVAKDNPDGYREIIGRVKAVGEPLRAKMAREVQEELQAATEPATDAAPMPAPEPATTSVNGASSAS